VGNLVRGQGEAVEVFSQAVGVVGEELAASVGQSVGTATQVHHLSQLHFSEEVDLLCSILLSGTTVVCPLHATKSIWNRAR
jgi:hypothetical protein